MSLSAEHSAMLKTWAKTFATALLASFLALGTPPWELEGTQWLSILWSGLLALAMVVYNWLDPKDPRYGHSNAVVLPLSQAPASTAASVPTPAAKPELKVAPAPKAPAAKKAPAAAKKAAAPKKAPAKRPAKKATDKK